MRACTSGPLYGIALLSFELQSHYFHTLHILPNPIEEKGLEPPLVYRRNKEMNKIKRRGLNGNNSGLGNGSGDAASTNAPSAAAHDDDAHVVRV